VPATGGEKAQRVQGCRLHGPDGRKKRRRSALSAFVFENVVGDHHPLDLRGAFVDGEDPGIAVVAFHGYSWCSRSRRAAESLAGDAVDHFREA